MVELLPGFYRITQVENINEADWAVQVSLNPQHPVYGGHFPQQPVVPGVCMLQMIKECMEKICHRSLQYQHVASCKFLSAVNPNETHELKFSFTWKISETDDLRIQAEGSTSKEVCIKLKAQLTGK